MREEVTQKPLQICEVCWITSDVKAVGFRKQYGRTLCDKHATQLKNHGEIIDATPYCCFDRNQYEIKDGIVYMKLFNRKYDLIGIAKFDEQFADKVLPRKWRPVFKSPSYYAAAIAKPEEKLSHIYLHRYIMILAGFDLTGMEVDHIDGDTMNNTLANLRLATRQQQMFNVSTRSDGQIPIRGVSFGKADNTYRVDFAVRKKRYYVKHFEDLNEAVFTRYLLEKYLIGDVATRRHYPLMKPYIDQLSEQTKADLDSYVRSKIKIAEVA